ncbi:MAG TPA: ABC transporter substrate-binding protein [Lacunisphaera sp.]|jgi:ABC-type branched-subunit amino acid transport system substrate-binding protein|nr:ABC transporter substrate-binding protein [Lacunisphaera sp.]
MTIRLPGLLACLWLAPLAAGAGPRPVTLGVIASPGDPESASLLHGAQLAVAEASTADAPVLLEVRSGSGQWGSVGNEAVTLVCERQADAIISPADGAATHLILQVSGRTRAPVASVCPDSSVTEAGVTWAVCVVPRTDLAAAALFAAARRPQAPPRHWWAIVPAGHPGRAVRRDLETAARATATPLDRMIDSAELKTDFATVVQGIVAAAPDGLLVWLPPAQAGALVAAVRTAGYGGHLAGSATLDSPEFFAAAGAAAAGVSIAEFQADAADRQRTENFARQYRVAHGVEPDFSAAAAFEAARVLIATLRRAGPGAGYREFPLAVSSGGMGGDLHFDRFGNRTDAMEVRICERGRFVALPIARNR